MQQKSAGPTVIKTRGMQLIERRIGQPLEEYLTEKYARAGWTTVQIAAALDVNSGTVSRWMALFGIEARIIGPRRVPA